MGKMGILCKAGKVRLQAKRDFDAKQQNQLKNRHKKQKLGRAKRRQQAIQGQIKIEQELKSNERYKQ
eukprot:403337798